ncbi:FecR family protein [Sphingobacterium yanglingense]|uniref:FecR family protein n=1 Tax=Sphingobacterium yanglingense TaxID=1437280 RepID=A0A4R6WC41_9SPHI|nr:FecR family protein [Sphingobacterium yanglingense]TDQ75180.1 FecR family protein [Sphingobacterium yanglingense]
MNNQEELRRLIARYNNNEATEEERLVLEHWYSTIDMVGDTGEAQIDHVGEELRLRIERDISELSIRNKPKKSLFKNWMFNVAALLLMAITFSVWKLDFTKRSDLSSVETSIYPGGYKATLELEGGDVVELESDQHGIRTGEKLSYFDGSPVKGLEKEILGSSEKAPVYVLKTPKGGTYQISLPDGSQVWLNAGSSLRYPAKFESDRRCVELEGEGYFEIKEALSGKVKKKFIVKSKHQEIEVLGTKFNVQAYSEDLKITTTLLEGSVKVSLLDKKNHDSSVFLKPGYQSTFDGEKFRLLKSVNVEEAIAWKNGLFVFKEASLQTVMKQIERWYDIEVEYRGGFSDELFNGKVHRDTKLTELLEILSFSKVDIKIDGRKVIIGSKNE